MKYVDKIKKIMRGLWAPFDSNNAKVIFLCLISAFIFWLFNALNKEYTTRIEQPIDFLYNRDSLISLNKLPKKISINVTGGGWNLLRKTIGVNTNPLIINLENPSNIRYLTQYNLLNIASDQLDELNVNFVISDTIYVNIARKKTKKFALGVDSASVDLARNYYIVSPIRVKPDSVELEGPEKVINRIPDKILLSIPDTEINGNFDEDIPVNLSLPELVYSKPEKVEVTFEVQEYENQTSQLNYKGINFPENANFKFSKIFADVTYKIPKDLKGAVDTTGFSIVADFNQMNKKDSTISLALKSAPEYLREVEILNPQVKVVIE